MALTDEAIERIKEMIVSGELRPGDRLPKEVDLAERLGLSRNSLREAVKALSLIRILQLGESIERMERARDVNELIQADLDFHRRIAAGSGNPVLASLIESLSAPTLRARVWRGLTDEGAATRTEEQHKAIHQAIASRNADVARSWAAIHVTGVEDWLRRAL